MTTDGSPIRPPHRTLSSTLLASLLLLLATACAAQAPTVSVLFGENSVWQRDLPVRLRGTAAPGAEVQFRSDDLGRANARADEDGHWTLSLSPLRAGGPYAYQLEAGGQTMRVGDVYVGDVFVCSGQSNMEWPVDNTDDSERATSLTDPLLHHLMIPKASVPTPKSEPDPKAFWQSAYPGRTEGFTAIGYYFAEELRRRHPEVPVGIINTSWGGSTIEAWLSDNAAGTARVATTAENEARWAELRATYPGAFAKTSPRISVDDARADGASIELGGLWEGSGYPKIDGTMWFDREFSLSERQLQSVQRAGGATLALGAIDDTDSTFVNGQFVGSSRDYTEARYHRVPAAALRSGANRLSVWVQDDGGGGGFSSPVDSLYLDTGVGRVRLGDAGWRVRPEAIFYDSLGTPFQRPSFLYNGMLEPIAGVKAKGVLWYQGESNAGNTAETDAYAGQIKQLVAQFRALADQPELPFVAVELPEWLPPVNENYQANGNWPAMRQAIRAVLELPAAGTVVAHGYGDTEDIHPRNKRPVALMLAEEMSRIAYGTEDEPRNSWPKELIAQGPSAVVVEFADVGGEGLGTLDGTAPQGFALQDASGRWHYAEARILGEDSVRLTASASEGAITAVAYAWSNNPDESNLVNGHGRRVGSWRMAMGE